MRSDTWEHSKLVGLFDTADKVHFSLLITISVSLPLTPPNCVESDRAPSTLARSGDTLINGGRKGAYAQEQVVSSAKSA